MLTIVWDVDDVLNNLMSMWFHAAWLPAHPDCTATYRDLSENPPHRALGITEQEYLASLDQFRISDMARHMTPNPEILRWLPGQGKQFRHIALTARPLESAPHASEWLFRHFGCYIRLFGVVPSRHVKTQQIYDTDKAEFLSWLGHGDLFVDDNPSNVAAVGKLGLRSFLFPQPWNGSRATVAEILRSIEGVLA